MKKLVLIVATVLVCSTSALAYCPEPVPPYAVGPVAPKCNNNVCDYQTVAAFRSQLQNYVNRLSTYANEANAYATCLQTQATTKWDRFARNNKVRQQ